MKTEVIARESVVKLGLVAALVTAALVNPPVITRWPYYPIDWWKVGCFAFGLFNAVIAVPGTLVARMGGVAVSVIVLSTRSDGGAAMLLAWFLWPPAYAAGWALARQSRVQADAGPNAAAPLDLPARVKVASIIAAVAAGALAYEWLVARSLQQTAALFIGVPSLMSVLLVLMVSPRSITGVACKAVAVGLLVSLVFLREGILCVLMSAPLFLAVAVVVSWTMQLLNDRFGSTTHCVAVLLLAVPLSLEGVTPATTINRRESISESKSVSAPAAEVERALFGQPRFGRALPMFLRANFPMPISTRIEAAGRPRWVIRMRGGETRLDGMESKEGDLVLALQEARPGFIRWRAVSDTSHMTHFLYWRETTVRWQALDPGTTMVTWTLSYDRGLDPAWYFGPLERYAVRLAARYLIDTVATP